MTSARFKLGDRVRILSPKSSLFVGVEGIVEEIKQNPRNLTQLDSYTLRFNWGEKQVFWDAQLAPVGEKAQRH